MPSQLAIYLRTHEASALAALDLARRTASSQRRKPYADFLEQLVGEAEQDHSSLRMLMRHLGIRPDPVLQVTLRLGERAGRLKPNGHLVTRAPLSDLLEVEFLLDMAYAKATVWRGLEAAGVLDGNYPVDLSVLVKRADDQVARLSEIHRSLTPGILEVS